MPTFAYIVWVKTGTGRSCWGWVLGQGLSDKAVAWPMTRRVLDKTQWIAGSMAKLEHVQNMNWLTGVKNIFSICPKRYGNVPILVYHCWTDLAQNQFIEMSQRNTRFKICIFAYFPARIWPIFNVPACLQILEQLRGSKRSKELPGHCARQQKCHVATDQLGLPGNSLWQRLPKSKAAPMWGRPIARPRVDKQLGWVVRNPRFRSNLNIQPINKNKWHIAPAAKYRLEAV